MNTFDRINRLLKKFGGHPIPHAMGGLHAVLDEIDRRTGYDTRGIRYPGGSYWPGRSNTIGVRIHLHELGKRRNNYFWLGSQG